MRERGRICRRCNKVGAFNPFRRHASYSPQLTDLPPATLRSGTGSATAAARFP